MEKCSFCGRKIHRALRVLTFTLCEGCEACLVGVRADSERYEWFLRAVRRAMMTT